MKTREIILKKAKQEFMTKGYEKASLRQIASRCNLTTGAIYGLFANKEELFGALVQEDLEKMKKSLLAMELSFQKIVLQNTSFHCMKNFAKLKAVETVKIFATHRTTLELLAFHSKGSAYERSLDFYYLLEKQENLAFFEKMKGRKANCMETQWIDIVSQSFITGLLQVLRKCKSQREMDTLIATQVMFYANGWIGILDKINLD